jgi:DNA polymerase elongation subunit (family B)
MEIEFIPIEYDYFDWQGRNYVRIIGRDNKDRQICLVDTYEPYLWAIFKQETSDKKIKELQKKIEKIKIDASDRETRVEKTEIHVKNFLGKEVKALKIFITNHKDAHAIADKLDMPEIQARREYDINLITKYIIDKKFLPFTWYKVSGDITDFAGLNSLDVSLCLMLEKHELKEKIQEFKPKILAFDIEADEFEIGKGEILMISLVSENFQKVLTWKQVSSIKKLDFVEHYRTEADMIEAFINYIKKIKPDVLVGYFSDGFDLPYLRARAEQNGIKLALGLDNKQLTFARGKYSSSKISGIVHVDLFRFIETAYSQYLESETLGLDEISSELLGENKLEFDHKHSSKIQDHEWPEYFKYNLQDSVLTFKLTEKIWPDMFAFSKIIQEPLFEVTRAGMSQLVELYILHHLQDYNEIAEKRPLNDEIAKRRAREKYEGAFVFQPKPGIYEKIVFFDFTSMYTSVAITYNLSLSSKLEKFKPNSLQVDLGKEGLVYFSKEKAFFSIMLEEIIKKRKKAKEEYKKNPDNIFRTRSNAYKLLANAAYGYQGFFGARYYCREAAASTAAMARKHILDCIKNLKESGYEVVYSDTDSIAFKLNEHSKEEVLELLEKMNKNLPGVMELELEDFYSRGLWVTKRTGEFGAKKKYALINEKGKLKIRGFETVRRDWCNLARKLQDEVLELILKEGNAKNALKIVQETIINIEKRKIPKEKLLIKTQLKKPIEEYISISPHVTIAKKMLARGMPVDVGMLIQFYIAESRTMKGKELIRERARLPDEPGEYDIKYYLEHQIIPAVENIFQVFGISKEELLGKKQMKLGEF